MVDEGLGDELGVVVVEEEAIDEACAEFVGGLYFDLS